MISEYFTDEELISELRMFFGSEEIDYKSSLNDIEEIDEDNFIIKIKGRKFKGNKQFCDLEEIK